MATASFAQKDKLNEAKKELNKATASAKDKPDEAVAAYQKGKEAIDLAAQNPETKDKPETWITRAGIYIGMQDNDKLNADNPYREGIVSLKKAIELNKKAESEADVVNMIANAAFFSYNDGINTYNQNKFDEAYALFRQSVDLLGPDKDKRFVLMPVIDTIRAQSQMFMGYTAFYGKRYDEAIAALSPLRTSPYLQKEANIYVILAQAYEQKQDKEQQLAVLKEGRQKFPDDKNLENLELNYFITSGKQDEMTSKLEESIAKNPTNPELQLNLGIVYANMAKPASGNPPANAAEYLAKSEAAYKKAAELAADNPVYQYQLGAFYFNQAADLNTAMNNLGTSKAEQARYNEMLKQRDAYFGKALPYLEKSKDIFKAKGPSKLKGEEAKFYHNSLTALKEIYNRTDQTDKLAEIKKLLAEIDG